MNDKFILRNALGDGGLTTEEKLANVRLLKKLWLERVTPDMVDLDRWVCGTHACIGGHMGKWPEFLALPGAYADANGYPGLLDLNGTDYALFGKILNAPRMFAPSGSIQYEGRRHYQIALDRMDAHINYLENLL